MKIKRSDINLMVPVGSYQSLMAAIHAGADSVYFGAENLNMRAKSAYNFTLNDLQKITRIAHENNLKTYLTLNTVIFDHEWQQMQTIIDAAKANRIDAVIASDISVIQYARKVGIDVHISTQLNITNIEAVRFYAQYADVMVLARELTLKQVAQITQKIEKQQITGPSGKLIEIELFTHGALCMAISGKCYLSLHEKNYSANRGQCMQTCRKGYVVTEKESGYQLEIDNEYIMSPKDLATINFLDQIIKAGVKVLKIEGRARPAEYVKVVTECYNEALQTLENNNYTKEKIDGWFERLKTVFNRGFWDGYYMGRKMGEWSNVYGSQATKRKMYIGKSTNYFKKINIAEFLIQADEINVGDEVIISGPTTGIIQTTIKEIRFEDKNVNKALKGQKISVPIEPIVRRADSLYKIIYVKQDLDF